MKLPRRERREQKQEQEAPLFGQSHLEEQTVGTHPRLSEAQSGVIQFHEVPTDYSADWHPAPERLVFTLAWKNFPLGPETLVTVEFHEADGETDVVLVQERLGTVRGRRGHALGWRLTLERLRQLVE